MFQTTERILAYGSRLVASPGSEVDIYVSCPHPHFDVSVEAVKGGTSLPGVPVEVHSVRVDSPANGRHGGQVQSLRPGSYCWSPVDRPVFSSSFALRTLARPSDVFTGGVQTLVAVQTSAGSSVRIALTGDRRVVGQVQPAGGSPVEIVLPRPVCSWFEVELGVDVDAGRLTLRMHSDTDALEESVMVDVRTLGGVGEHVVASAAASLDVGRAASGGHLARDFFNGKLEAPRVSVTTRAPSGGRTDVSVSSMEVVLAWDFSDWSDLDVAPDRSGNERHGRLVNTPLRAVTGACWTGRAVDWRVAPEQYGAALFHEDSLTDAGWMASLVLPIDDGWNPGLYVLKLSARDLVYDLPIFVTRPVDERRVPIAVLASTFTYMAYSNVSTQATEHEPLSSESTGHNTVTEFVTDHPWVGQSLYDRHSDGTGIHYVSHLRPMLDLQPSQPSWVTGGGWGLSADLALLAWLNDEGFDVELVTDHDLDDLGPRGLDGYDVLLTGSHPEYVSERMYDALIAFNERGGRTMYLGGNGFYWVVRREGAQGELVEVRRGHGSTRTWESAPGQGHHLDGQPGALWRHRGRPPQKYFLVGFAAQGFSDAAPYAWSDGVASNPRTDFIVDGVDVDAGQFGAEGGILGGAAGEEIDRVDEDLGTPRHAIVLASSAGLHSADYVKVIEDCLHITGAVFGTTSAEVRADVAFAETPGGGAVFATGSIDWIACLGAGVTPDATVRTVTRNVLRRFADPLPFACPKP